MTGKSEKLPPFSAGVDWIWQASWSTGREVLAYLCLYHFAYHSAGNALVTKVTLDELAAKAATSYNSIRRALPVLEANGAITIERKNSDKLTIRVHVHPARPVVTDPATLDDVYDTPQVRTATERRAAAAAAIDAGASGEFAEHRRRLRERAQSGRAQSGRAQSGDERAQSGDERAQSGRADISYRERERETG